MPEQNLQEIFDVEGEIDYDKVVEIVHTNLKNFLNAVLEESFTSAGDENYRIQVTETSNKLCNQSFDAFLERRHIVSSEFYVELESRFYTSNTIIQDSRLIHHSEIQSIDTDLIELTLAVDQLIERSVKRHEDILGKLSLQLEELSFRARQAFNTNCLHPDDFYKLFLNSLSPLNIHVDGKILISKLLYHNISPNLNDFYLAMHSFLLDVGIEAVEPFSTPSSTNTVIEPENDNNSDPAMMSMSTGQFFAPVEQDMWNQEFESNHDNNEEILDKNSVMDVYGPGQTGLDEATINLLLQPYRPGTQSNSSAAQRRQFVRALSSVQKVEAASNAIFQAKQIKTAVRRTLHEKGALDAIEIVDNEEKVIDFVSNIYEVILDDDSLSDAIKALLAKLQISTIKLALIDFTFFQNARHPARQLLNKLTSIGLSVSGNDEILFLRLKEIIKNVTDYFETDVQIFSQALDEINKLDGNFEEKLDQQKESTYKQNSKRSSAKRIVIHTIKKFSKNKVIPNQILEFSLKCWAPHMAYIYMNHGRSSREWRNSVRTLRRAIEVSQGIHTLEEINKYIHEPENFFNKIRIDLEHFSRQTEEFDEVLEAAEVWYLTQLRKIEKESEEVAEDNTNYEDVADESNQQSNVINLFKNLSVQSEKHLDKDEQIQDNIPEVIEKEDSLNEDAVINQKEEPQSENEDEVQSTLTNNESADSKSSQQIETSEEPEESQEIEIELNVSDHLPVGIVPGVWLEVYQGEEKAKRRLKYSSANTDTNHLTFIDRSGDYRFEIDLQTFLDDYSAGKSTLISESNRFDLALSSVISNIRSSQDNTDSD
ncbi:MAG: DUF1631 family protein [Pseudomonadota bacterium]